MLHSRRGMKRGIKGKKSLRKGLPALAIPSAAELRSAADSEACITGKKEGYKWQLLSNSMFSACANTENQLKNRSAVSMSDIIFWAPRDFGSSPNRRSIPQHLVRPIIMGVLQQTHSSNTLQHTSSQFTFPLHLQVPDSHFWLQNHAHNLQSLTVYRSCCSRNGMMLKDGATKRAGLYCKLIRRMTQSVNPCSSLPFFKVWRQRAMFLSIPLANHNQAYSYVLET